MTGRPDPGATPRPRRPRPDQPLRARWDPTPEPSDVAEAVPTNPFVRFAQTYGWRAYAIPVLAVLTIVLLVVTIRGGDSPSDGAAPVDPDARNVKVSEETHAIGAPTGEIKVEALPAGALPAGGPFATKADEVYRMIRGTAPRAGKSGQVYTYSVEVERGIDPDQYGGDRSFAKIVDATLANPRSWTGDGKVSFQRVDSNAGGKEPDLRISLSSTGTARQLCGYQIKLETSCYYPPNNRVVINQARWVRGASAFAGDDISYRQYLINHEVGHGIGYEHHKPCPKNGDLAPIMMQQTFGTANSDIMALDPDIKADATVVCRPNAWPFPTA